ncbi:MAG: aminotransferase class V-fold PLP-dependent enzyme [Deltaproteobacteria bacterium]|nr:aminotransferase class V-fold PLP-dependent enzyme [Kofleriaceae bacterium]
MTAPRTPQPGRRDAPLAMTGDGFRRLGHRLVERIAELLEDLPGRPVTRDESPEVLKALLGGAPSVPEGGADAAALLDEAATLLFDHSLFNGHPSFLGYVTASPAPIGILADFLASAVNANTGAWRLSPIASEIELQTIDWLADLVGFPRGGGLLVSGGNMANIVALLAARRAAATWDLRRDGVRPDDAPRLRVYATDETHTWLQKAVDLAGLGGACIHWIATDEQQRMRPEALREAVAADRAAGELPMLVVATAGTVSTGALDPLGAIADVCERERVWMHVDGCYGGVAACVPDAPPPLAELGRADSLALDPHKWLYAPLEAGALLVRDRERLRDAFAYHPPYYHFGQEATNFVDLGPQNSRGFRALKVWLALRQVGRAGYAQMIGEDMRLARWLAGRVQEHPELELATQSLSITTFRFVPAELRARPADAAAELDALNREVLDRVQRSGAAFVSNAVVRGRYVLRPCIVNFHTDERALGELIELVVRIGREVVASWGSGARSVSPSRTGTTTRR